eukprot:CAMPEP_0201586668 /NCGR_PEP_ID=MMETSP0190_2-20130828/135157_1 /ASSEMBLY_ACC=CAM_ASM_000263 /TAXON_ID=37353 /ORGANISM="Rosalina sp." /LENGTH=36 /DNA_ID= /DNA_START= /DNA_END= /DNA_ORIENTATION=
MTDNEIITIAHSGNEGPSFESIATAVNCDALATAKF